MIQLKSALRMVLALLAIGAVLASGRVTASAFDDFRAEQAQREADLRAMEAEQAAVQAHESARDAEFARFEAESRAARRPAKVFEYKRIGPAGTSYIERHDYTPLGGGSYVEHYESW